MTQHAVHEMILRDFVAGCAVCKLSSPLSMEQELPGEVMASHSLHEKLLDESVALIAKHVLRDLFLISRKALPYVLATL